MISEAVRFFGFPSTPAALAIGIAILSAVMVAISFVDGRWQRRRRQS